MKGKVQGLQHSFKTSTNTENMSYSWLSLSRVGQKAASTAPVVADCFGILQQLFGFLSG
jgi:hypothetical protein